MFVGGCTLFVSVYTMAAVIAVVLFTSTCAASWPGADQDSHPRLYVTAQDVAKARAALSSAELAAFAGMRFADHYDGTGKPDDLVYAALVAHNAGAQKAVVKVAFEAIDKLLAAMPATIEKRTGPHQYAKQAGLAAGLADAALAGDTITTEQRTALLNKIVEVNELHV